MSEGQKPGCHGLTGRRHVNDGTSCRQPSPRPGSAGLMPAFGGLMSSVGSTFDEWSSSAGKWIDESTEIAGGHAKSLGVTLLDLIPFKESSPFSTALLRHYVDRSGEPYALEDIPEEWQDWIAKATHGRVGAHKDLNPYNSGLYDLRNSLGHFRVDVEANKDGTKTDSISDTYEFGFIKHDRAQRGRHGFPLGDLGPWQRDRLRGLLPSDVYSNPGGFKERWELKTVGKETILFIPQQYLARQGKAFRVTGRFVR